jgi:hypothetical protein
MRLKTGCFADGCDYYPPVTQEISQMINAENGITSRSVIC